RILRPRARAVVLLRLPQPSARAGEGRASRERVAHQAIERRRLEQRPPVRRDVLAGDELLRLAALDVGCRDRGRDRAQRVALDGRNLRWLHWLTRAGGEQGERGKEDSLHQSSVLR